MTRDEPAPHPCVIATIGLHGSGSTWAFNVARELVGRAGGGAPVSGYADALGELPPGAEDATVWRVLKSHHGSAGMDRWLEGVGARYLLTLRDPRDAALSMRGRFGIGLGDAVRIVFNDCRRLHGLMTRREHFLLRYESGFFRDAGTVAAVAAWLGVDAAEAEAIALRYTPEATRAFAAGIAALPADRIGDRGAGGGRFDRLTNIHDVHIGDMRSGKWRDLPEGVQAEMTGIFREYLEVFGYGAGGAPSVGSR